MGAAGRELILRGYDALARGDVEGLIAILADDVVWHVPGRSPLSGAHRGHQGVRDHLALLRQLAGSFRIELHDLLDSDEHVVAIVRAVVTRGGRTHVLEGTQVWHLAAGKAVQFRFLPADLYADDAFWTS